jgi:hypothetical protein
MKENPMRTSSQLASVFTLFAALLLASSGCSKDKDKGGDNENEVITTVSLTFTPSGGGAAVTASVDDPDGDGGNPPTIQPITLAAGMYDLTVKFLNKQESPPEDITKEVMDESDQHFVFYTGTAVNGPASNQPAAPLTQAYADVDARGLPIGLTNKITATAGTGMLTVTLRHLPPVNGTPVKAATLPDTVRNSMGFTSIGGSTDAQVTFPVTVQ